MDVTTLETDRLILRQWRKTDYPIFAELNADNQVMEYFPSLLSEDASNAIADRCTSLTLTRGWGFWAVELKPIGEFIGFVGLHVPNDRLPFSPCVEIGWRLAKQYWKNGYATEAASEALTFAFETLNLKEVVLFTSVHNYPSRSVMERIGLLNTNQNFLQADIPKEHPLSQHVLYKIIKSGWQDNDDLKTSSDRADEPTVSYEKFLKVLSNNADV